MSRGRALMNLHLGGDGSKAVPEQVMSPMTRRVLEQKKNRKPSRFRLSVTAAGSPGSDTTAEEERAMSPMTKRVLREQKARKPSRFRTAITAAGSPGGLYDSPPRAAAPAPGGGPAGHATRSYAENIHAGTMSPTDFCMSPVSAALEKRAHPHHAADGKPDRRPRRFENLAPPAGEEDPSAKAAAKIRTSPVTRHALRRANTPPRLAVRVAPAARPMLGSVDDVPMSPSDFIMSPATQFVNDPTHSHVTGFGAGGKASQQPTYTKQQDAGKKPRRGRRFSFEADEIASSPHTSASEAAARVARSFSSDDASTDRGISDDDEGDESDRFQQSKTPPPRRRVVQASSTPRADAMAEEWAAKTPEEKSFGLARMFLRRSASRRNVRSLPVPEPVEAGAGSQPAATSTTRDAVDRSGMYSPSDGIMSPVTAQLRTHFSRKHHAGPVPKLQPPPARAHASGGAGASTGGKAAPGARRRPTGMHIRVNDAVPARNTNMNIPGMMSPSDQIMSPVSHALRSGQYGFPGAKEHPRHAHHDHHHHDGHDHDHADTDHGDAKPDADALAARGRAGMIRNLSVSDLKGFVRGAFNVGAADPAAAVSPVPSPSSRRALAFKGRRVMGSIGGFSPKSSLSPSNRGAFAKRSPPPPPPVRPLNPGPAAAGTMPSPTARSGGNTSDELAALEADAQPVEHDLLGSGSEDEEEARNTSSGGAAAAAAAAAASPGDSNDAGSGAESGDQVGDMQAPPREPRRRSLPRSPSAHVMARSALSPGRVRRSVSHGNLGDAGMSLRDRSLTPVSQRVLDVARKSRDNRMLQLYPKNTNMTSPPTARPRITRSRAWSTGIVDPRSPPDPGAVAHALLRRKKPVPSPGRAAPRRTPGDKLPSSLRRGGAAAAPAMTSPSDDLVSPASRAVATIHRHGGATELPVRRYFGAGNDDSRAGDGLAQPQSPSRSQSSPARTSAPEVSPVRDTSSHE